MEQKEQLQGLLVTTEVCRRTCAVPCVFGGMKAIFLTGLPEIRNVWIPVSAMTHWNGKIRDEWRQGDAVDPSCLELVFQAKGAQMASGESCQTWSLSSNWASLGCKTWFVFFTITTLGCLLLTVIMHHFTTSHLLFLQAFIIITFQSSRLFWGASWWINAIKMRAIAKSRWWLDNDFACYLATFLKKQRSKGLLNKNKLFWQSQRKNY